jgi:hypothetical protein
MKQKIEAAKSALAKAKSAFNQVYGPETVNAYFAKLENDLAIKLDHKDSVITPLTAEEEVTINAEARAMAQAQLDQIKADQEAEIGNIPTPDAEIAELEVEIKEGYSWNPIKTTYEAIAELAPELEAIAETASELEAIAELAPELEAIAEIVLETEPVPVVAAKAKN